MRPKLFFIPLFILCFWQASAQMARKDSFKYYNKDFFLLEGTSIPESEKESPYDRLPASSKDKVRQPVWELSKSSAGMSVRFISNATAISVRWELLNNNTMNHMAETGIKGLDLYCKVKNGWQYVNTARPEGKTDTAILVTGMIKMPREYRIFLPLYDGLVKLEVGIDSAGTIEKPAASSKKPIVFYGTSILQGGCASRPGMAHTNIISRKTNTECINLGFSGNGRMEQPIVEVMARTDAAFYVIDCSPNMSAAQIDSNAIPLVRTLRASRPQTPIVFIENLLYEKSFLDTALQHELINKNDVLKQQYKKMLAEGMKRIYYIESTGAIGTDHEGTVDGIHFTDLGFMRYADFLLAKFRKMGLISAPALGPND